MEKQIHAIMVKYLGCILIPTRRRHRMLFNTDIELGRPFGIPVKLHFTLLLLAAMFVFRADGANLFAMLVNGLVAAVALLAAVLFHELGHSVVAMAFGGKVRDITLMFFGGLSTIYYEPRDPWRQAAIALAGPGAGLVLWLVCQRLLPFLPFPALQDAFRVMGFYSFWLSIFNMIPAYPMDGGRVLRAVLSSFIGRIKAAKIACTIARFLAIAMGLYGLAHLDVFLIMIALFVWGQASSELAALNRFRGADDDDDTVIISPPPFGRENDYTKIKRER